MPNESEFVKNQLSKVKEKILVIARAENARKRQQKKRKARRNFEKKKFKLTKKLFMGEKNRVLNIPRTWKHTFGKNIQTDTPLEHRNEPNHQHLPEEKYDDSPLKLCQKSSS